MAQRSSASTAILAVSLELLAVGVFTLIAGASDDVATIVLLFMTGMWIIFLITQSSVIAGLENALTTIAGNPTNK